MRSIFLAVGTLTTALAGPLLLVRQDTGSPADTLVALTSTVETHTANINKTLAALPSAPVPFPTAAAGNSTNSSTINGEFMAIATALNTSSLVQLTSTVAHKRSAALFTRVNCDATCQENVYTQLGTLSAEIAYTMQGCILKNAVDITSSSSVLVPAVQSLANVAAGLGTLVEGVSGVVVQKLLAAMGTDVGGALSSLVTSTPS